MLCFFKVLLCAGVYHCLRVFAGLFLCLLCSTYLNVYLCMCRLFVCVIMSLPLCAINWSMICYRNIS